MDKRPQVELGVCGRQRKIRGSFRQRLQRRVRRRARVVVAARDRIDPVLALDGLRRVRDDNPRRRHSHPQRLVHLRELVAALLGGARKAEIGRRPRRRTHLKDGVGRLGKGVESADRPRIAVTDDHVRASKLHGAAGRDGRLRVAADWNRA